MSDLSDIGFDASKVEPPSSVVPKGEYDAVIVSSERKSTQAGNGWYLKLDLQILGGQFQNRHVFDNLNLCNNGEKKQITEEIAKGKLSAICRAVGVLTPKDSSELHNKPLKISVGVKDNPEYGMQNVINAYKPRTAGPTTSVETVAQNVTPNTLAGTPAPW